MATIFFVHDDGTHGVELLATDGTPGNQYELTDSTSPGVPDDYGSNPNNFVNFNNALFLSDDWYHQGVDDFGQELARSDGASVTLTNINPDDHTGSDDSDPGNLTPVYDPLNPANDKLFFTAFDGNSAGHGYELWVLDGGGTHLVKDITPGPQPGLGANDHRPYGLANVAGTLLFAADDGSGGGFALWKSDGTAGGTTMVVDIRPGANDPGFGDPTAVGNLLFFTADIGSGVGLWRSSRRRHQSAREWVKSDEADQRRWHGIGPAGAADLIIAVGLDAGRDHEFDPARVHAEPGRDLSGAGGSAIRLPQLIVMSAVVGYEVDGAVDVDEMGRVGRSRPNAGVDVGNHLSAGRGAVRFPQLAAMHAIIGDEVQPSMAEWAMTSSTAASVPTTCSAAPTTIPISSTMPAMW